MVNSIMKKGAGFVKDPIVPISSMGNIYFSHNKLSGSKKARFWARNQDLCSKETTSLTTHHKVPKTDFQSEFSMSRIIQIF